MAQQSDIDAAVELVRNSPERDTINRWIHEGHHHGRSWSPRAHPTELNVARLYTARILAEAASGDEDCTRLLIATATGGFPPPPDQTIGETIGRADPATCHRIHALAIRFGNDLTLIYHPDGSPALVGDTAAILAAV